MEVLSENPVESFGRSRELHELDMETNSLLGLAGDILSDETEQTLFRILESKPNSVRLEETKKWTGYLIRHGDDFKNELGAGLAYTGDIEELEVYFQDMDELEEQQRSEELNPIEQALLSLKGVNSEVVLIGIKSKLQDLYSQVTH